MNSYIEHPVSSRGDVLSPVNEVQLVRNRIDARLTFVTTLELSRLFVEPLFNLFDAT